MNEMQMKYRVIQSFGSRVVGLAVVMGLTVLASSYILSPALFATAEPPQEETPVHFDGQGWLIRPTGYRTWVYIGTPLTPNDMNPPEAPFPDFHNVYIDPESYDHYMETGNFREGTVLVKELVSVGSKAAASGRGYFMGEFIGLEAAVKDSNRFPDEPGNWAYFSFGHSYPLADTAEKFPAAACSSCHEAAAADNGVFTQYYPVLRAAKGPRQSSLGSPSSASPSGAAMRSGDESYDRMADTMLGASESAMKATADTPTVDSVVPTEAQRLHEFLKAGSYRSFESQESEKHASRGPHAKFSWPVRVYLDAKIDASLAAGNASHPAGSSIVKEMYSEDGSELLGWAVMVKTQEDSAQGQGWFWYETTNTEDSSDIVGVGNGLPLCSGCHSTGKDFVLTEYPPK